MGCLRQDCGESHWTVYLQHCTVSYSEPTTAVKQLFNGIKPTIKHQSSLSSNVNLVNGDHRVAQKLRKLTQGISPTFHSTCEKFGNSDRNFSRMERALYLWRPTPDVNSFGVSTLAFKFFFKFYFYQSISYVYIQNRN